MSEQETSQPVPRFCRVRKAAERLGVSVRTLYRIVAQGHLRIVRVRNCACISEADLSRYMNNILEGRAS